MSINRRSLLKASGLALSARLLAPNLALAAAEPQDASALVRLSFNENPYGPSPTVATAIQRELTRLNRYADATAAQHFAEQIAAYERIPVEQVVLGKSSACLASI